MFEQVKQEIDDKIKTNGNNEITANRLNSVLQDMMDASAKVIDEVQQSIGDQVEANPTGEPTESLEKIKIGEEIYEIPQGVPSDMSFDKKLQTQANINNQESSEAGRLGYVVLQPEKQGVATTTFAAQIANKPNTIFEIRDVFDLHDEPVSVPDNCTLKFNGGMLNNGILNGTPYIDANTNGVLGDVVVHGVANEKTELRWFLANGISVKYAIENACACAHNSKNFVLDGNNIEVTLLNTVNITENNDCNMQNLNIKFVPTADNQNMFLCSTTSKYQAQLLFIKDSTFEVLAENKTHDVNGKKIPYRNINCIHFRQFDVTTKAYIHNVYVKGFSGYMFVCESYLQEIDFFNFKGGHVGGFISFNREYDAENPNASPFGNFGRGSSNILTFNQCGIDLGIDVNNDIQDIVSLSRIIYVTLQSCVFQGQGRGLVRNLYYITGLQLPHLIANDCWNEFVGRGTISYIIDDGTKQSIQLNNPKVINGESYNCSVNGITLEAGSMITVPDGIVVTNEDNTSVLSNTNYCTNEGSSPITIYLAEHAVSINNLYMDDSGIIEIQGGRFVATHTINHKNVLIKTDTATKLDIKDNSYRPSIWINGIYNTYTTIGNYIETYKDVADLRIELSSSNTYSEISDTITYNPFERSNQIPAIAKEHSDFCKFISVGGIPILRQQPHTSQDNSDTSKIYLLSKTGNTLVPQKDWYSPLYHLVYRVYPLVPVTQENIDLLNSSDNTPTTTNTGDGISSKALLFNSGNIGTLFTLNDTSTNPNDYPWKEVITNFISLYKTTRETHGLWGIDIAVCEIITKGCMIDRSIKPMLSNPLQLEVPDPYDNSIVDSSIFTPANGEMKGYTLFDSSIGAMVTWNGTAWVDENGYTPYKKSGSFANKPTFANGTNIGAEYFATDIRNGMKIVWNGSGWYCTDGTDIPTYHTVTNSTTSGKGISLSSTEAVLSGDTYEALVTSELGLDVEDIIVTMGGVEVANAFDEATQKITVTNVDGDIVVSGGDLIPRVLTFTAKEANSTVQFVNENTKTVSLETSTDGITWNPYTIGNVITLENIDDIVMFRGSNGTTLNTWVSGIDNGSNTNHFSISGNVYVSGDATSLLNNIGGNVTLGDYAFIALFKACSISNSPNLPSTNLGRSCFAQMFNNCTSLAAVPALPATTLASSCYSNMFYNCTSIVEAPELPAETPTDYCYNAMFYQCSSLNKITMRLKSLSTGSLSNWVYGVAAAGSLYCDTSLELTTGNSGIQSGWTRYNLDGTLWENPNAE